MGFLCPAIAPTGDRLAYLRGGKIEMLTLAGGSTSDLAEAPQVTALSWAKDQILWATNEGIFTGGADGQSQLASIPQNATVVSIAPDGGHAVYQEGQSLHVLDLATSRSRGLGGAAAFLGWSPDGSRMLYAGNQETVVADAQGQKIASILSGDVSWSSKDEILIGDDTDLYAVRPDGYGRTLLNSGTYRNPVWAPDGVTFTYVRGGAIWSATTAPLPLEPPALDQAASVVSQFMNARIAKHGDQAQAFLDNKGKQAYSSSGLPLVITGDATFTRDYVVVQQMTDLQAQTARFVVRLVLSKGSLDVSEFEETLTLKRDDASQPFLIDQAGANSTRDLGKGAEVVSADVATGSMKVVFDSDLVADTVADGVVVLDANGKRVGSPSTYANRTVVITGLDLAPGASYKLVVLTSVQDVSGRNVAAEYDLNVVGPAQASSPTAPSPEPSPEPTPSPSPSPSPSA